MDETKKILFLGGNGFLGKNVQAFYRDHPVEGPPLRFAIAGRHLNPSDLLAPGDLLPLDFSEQRQVAAAFEQPFDEVFHFVSATVPANSNNDMRADIQANLVSTVFLLEQMVAHKVKKITFISSGGAIYGDAVSGGSQEQDFNNPNNSYGIVKLAIEKYIALFAKLHGITYLILRVSNPFGPYHTSERNGIVNIAIRKALRGEPVTVWGDGNSTKDYLYSEDFARIFWELFRRGIQNQILNVGSGQLYSVLDILSSVKQVEPSLTWQFGNAQSFDTPKVAFKLDSLRKIIELSTTDFAEAVRRTCAWERGRMSE